MFGLKKGKVRKLLEGMQQTLTSDDYIIQQCVDSIKALNGQKTTKHYNSYEEIIKALEIVRVKHGFTVREDIRKILKIDDRLIEILEEEFGK